jgi:hypothetical protein
MSSATFTHPAKQSGEAARVQSHDDLATYSLTICIHLTYNTCCNTQLPTMFHQGDLQSGISAAIQEQKLVACFIRQGTIGFHNQSTHPRRTDLTSDT